MKSEYQVPYLYVPIDEEGYTQSFSIQDDNDLMESKDFFDEFGFVVYRDVLTHEACESTLSEIFDIMESSSGFQRDEIGTWDHWPTDSIERYGNISKPSIFRRQFMLNRMNPNLHKACATILEDEDIIVSHDRACFYRPTTQVMIDGTLQNKDGWKTQTNIHLDMNPWHWMEEDDTPIIERSKLTYYDIRHWIAENNLPSKEDGISIQGSINLIDNKEEDGGYLCVPGFHKVIEDYFRYTQKPNDGPSVAFHYKDKIQERKIRVSMREGSIILWDQRMAHGSTRNRSSTPRSAQFFRMFKRSTMTEERAVKRRKSLVHKLNLIPGVFEVSELGMREGGI
eukprot:TRINITY_DN6609_c0_g1_i1.p1 TRINITY_DN6609_c0_g1~~TRINITY_DN6609_c0_g1_i1.p1  ORF type:complete len:347 (-),score=59.44 TRINITY_DN6609_c0_g1_i1:13-1029(-)